jgi:hypothetical protein
VSSLRLRARQEDSVVIVFDGELDEDGLRPDMTLASA